MQILQHGEMQLGDKEREQQLDVLTRDVLNIVAEKCILIETKKPVPLSYLEKVMREVHFAIVTTKSAKQQVFCPSLSF